MRQDHDCGRMGLPKASHRRTVGLPGLVARPLSSQKPNQSTEPSRPRLAEDASAPRLPNRAAALL